MYDTFLLFREGDAVGIYISEHVSKGIPSERRTPLSFMGIFQDLPQISSLLSYNSPNLQKENEGISWQSFLLVRWLWLGWSSEPWRSAIHCGVWRHACALDAESYRVDGLTGPPICWKQDELFGTTKSWLSKS